MLATGVYLILFTIGNVLLSSGVVIERNSTMGKSVNDILSYPVPRKRERNLHTCAQDVQITRMATI
jgi:uncharacterized membrane protein YczE